jgi:translation initiation factor 1
MESIHLRIEKKGRKGKIVTIIEGFTSHRERIEELARVFKINCGTGGAVKNNAIEVQGDFRKQASEFFKSNGFLVKGFQ